MDCTAPRPPREDLGTIRLLDGPLRLPDGTPLSLFRGHERLARLFDWLGVKTTGDLQAKDDGGIGAGDVSQAEREALNAVSP